MPTQSVDPQVVHGGHKPNVHAGAGLRSIRLSWPLAWEDDNGYRDALGLEAPPRFISLEVGKPVLSGRAVLVGRRESNEVQQGSARVVARWQLVGGLEHGVSCQRIDSLRIRLQVPDKPVECGSISECINRSQLTTPCHGTVACWTIPSDPVLRT